jgi:predicted methyltransferase
MTKIIRLIFLLILSISTLSCSEDIDTTNFTSAQKALHNKERPDDDRDSDKSRKPEQILDFSKITSGMVIADLDAGAGYYTELFSFLVGTTGKVYMQNGPRYIGRHSDKVEERLEDNRLTNAIRLDSSYKNLNLPDNIDLVFISLAYHDIYVSQDKEEWNADVASYFDQIHKALKDNGRLIIIDHSALAETGSTAANSLHRIDEKFARSDIESRGFSMTASSDALRNPNDDRALRIWNEKVNGKTDQFVMMFSKVNK